MKILQISPSFYPAISIGGPIFSTLTFTEILEKNHQVTTLTTQQGLDNEQLTSITYNSNIQLSDKHTKIYKKYVGPANFTFSWSLLAWLIRHGKNTIYLFYKAFGISLSWLPILSHAFTEFPTSSLHTELSIQNPFMEIPLGLKKYPMPYL